MSKFPETLDDENGFKVDPEGRAQELALKELGITRGCCRLRFLALVLLHDKHIAQMELQKEEAARRPRVSRFTNGVDCELDDQDDNQEED